MKRHRFLTITLGLTFLAVVLIVLFLMYQTYGNWAFAFRLRGKKIIAFLLVSLAASTSTIAFQTITHNQFLTPSILGLDNLYVLIQTLLFYLVGGIQMLSQASVGLFLVNILLMVGLSVLFLGFFLNRTTGNLFLLLMVGMVAGTFFSSLSTYLQVLMDPNEYDLLQGKLFASFSNIPTQYLGIGAILIVVASIGLWQLAAVFDVMHLGRDHAVNLGISVSELQVVSLVLIALLTGVSTSLVGPTLFLGFILSTLSYHLFHTYRHRQLFLGSFLLGVILLVGGQFLVEQIFEWNTTISVVIQFVGGVFFILKIVSERKTR